MGLAFRGYMIGTSVIPGRYRILSGMGTQIGWDGYRLYNSIFEAKASILAYNMKKLLAET